MQKVLRIAMTIISLVTIMGTITGCGNTSNSNLTMPEQTSTEINNDILTYQFPSF